MNSREQSKQQNVTNFNYIFTWLFRELLAQVHVLPDDPSGRFKQLPTTSHIKSRAKVQVENVAGSI